MKRLIPDTIAIRTLLAMILGLAVSHAISVALYITDRSSALATSGGEHIGEGIATIDRLIRNSSEAERQRLVQLADDPRFQVTLTRESTALDQPESNRFVDEFRTALIAHLDREGEREVRFQYLGKKAPDPSSAPAIPETMVDSGEEIIVVSLPLPEKSWLNFVVKFDAPEPSWSFRFSLSMAIMLSAIAILSVMVVHHLSRPLATFVSAAQRLGVDVRAPPLPETGPAEVRKATRVFNEMQGRIQRFVEDRTQMIAAISHDLGTPITRMRLRAEFVEDDEQRQKMLADLDDMEKMTLSTLSFARDEAAHEPQAMVDLNTLLQRVCDDTSDAGHRVTLDIDEDPIPYGCRPVAMRRAVSNLIENAVKYGSQARVSLEEDAGAILITIDDDGPGIPLDRQEDMFKPFHRLEDSRNRETGGTGLGLTVARTIIRAHGGDIALINRDEGGLRVVVTLPR